MTLGYDRADYLFCGLKLPRMLTFGEAISSLLIAGKSGSGKSLSLRWYIYQLLATCESRVFITDYKGGLEYAPFEGSHAYASGEAAFRMIEDYYTFFTAAREHRIRSPTHYTLVVEEWLGLLTYAETQSKKLRAELTAKIGEILAVGRGLNIGLILCVQRADAALFSNGSREQFQAVMAFGRTSSEHFRMLGFSAELEENPTSSYKAGQALCLIDGQEAPFEIIVPFIKNHAEMTLATRMLLDRQPVLAELTRAHGEAGSPGQNR